MPEVRLHVIRLHRIQGLCDSPELDRPSLAVELPNGTIAATDDWHHRVVVISRQTKQIIWQYGHFNRPGSDAGYLSKPDGLQLLG